MITSHGILTMIGLIGWASHEGDALKYNSDGYSSQPKQKQPVILMHKQALSENGAFNFAFAGDNGIQQGETINPDGTRTGAYSYVDPNGEKISVKYSAGKDGFRILQGDHVPRAPVVHPAALYGAASSATAAKYTPSYGRGGGASAGGGGGGPAAASEEFDDDFGFGSATAGGGGGAVASYSHHRAKVNPALYRVREDGSAEHFPTHFVPVAYGRPATAQARSHDGSDEYDGRPHSFGSGYSFEFGSGGNN